MLTLRTLALAALPSSLLLASACDASEIGDDLGAVELRPFGCSACGSGFGNSPVVNGNTLHHFSLDGTRNEDGLRIIGAEFADTKRFPVTVDPSTEQWLGLDPDTGIPSYVGTQMLGARLVLEDIDGQEISLELVEIDTEVLSWSNSGTKLSAYRALYKDAQGQQQSVCPSLALDEQWFVLIAGETYDPVTHQVHADPAWVTLACAGQAAAKMKLLGYHAAGPRQSTPDERQATLRMITADYCGTGTSFTTAGAQVAWRDSANTVDPPFTESTLEAMWGPNGAICLDTPRYVDRSVLEDWCDIPTCTGEDFPVGAVWRTMLP